MIHVKCFKKSEQACCDIYCAILILLACSYLFLLAVGVTRHLWPMFTASFGHCSTIFTNCFLLLLFLNLNVDKWLHFSSLSALVSKFCHYLTTFNKNDFSLFTFSVLYMLLLDSTVSCPPLVPMFQVAGLFNLIFFYGDVYFTDCRGS